MDREYGDLPCGEFVKSTVHVGTRSHSYKYITVNHVLGGFKHKKESNVGENGATLICFIEWSSEIVLWCNLEKYIKRANQGVFFSPFLKVVASEHIFAS